MTETSAELPGWSRQRWWVMISAVLALQTLLILLLEKHSNQTPVKTGAMPLVQLRPDISLQNFLVSDPTLFVFPHPHGFSGEAWLNNLPAPGFQPADWNEPSRALPLIIDDLGADFGAFISANASPPFQSMVNVKISPSVPVLYPMANALEKSFLKIEGPLSRRRLLQSPQLPAWSSADLVTNSTVQLLVGAQGETVSAVLLSPGIRLKKQEEADAAALELAKVARFEPAEAATVGTMIFEWQTLAPPATNAVEQIP